MQLLLNNGFVHDVEKHTFQRRDILVADGRIARVAEKISPDPDTRVVELGNQHIYPGFIDSHTHIGLVQEGYSRYMSDTNEKDKTASPALRALDGIYHNDEVFEDLRRSGITTVCIGPGSGTVISGTMTVVKPYRDRVIDDMVIREKAGIKCALGENPKNNAEHRTRMGNLYLLRKQLYRARRYLEKGDVQDKKDSAFDILPLVEVLQHKLPLRIHAHRSDDIMSALRLKREFDIPITIEHGAESYLVAEHLARVDVPVIIGPNLSFRSKQETLRRSFKTPAILKQQGVRFSFMTDHPVLSAYMLPYVAGIYMRHGLSFYDALQGITLDAARVLGVDERVGSITEGKDADLLVYTNDPFHIASQPKMVFIEGRQVYPEPKES